MTIDYQISTIDGMYDTPKDAGKGQSGIVQRWLQEIALADKREKVWKENAKKTIEIYRGENKSQNSFNILWSNIEVLRPNLYNSTPKPDVRQRYRDRDAASIIAAKVLERCLSYTIDLCDFDHTMSGIVLDEARQGRGVGRIRLEHYDDPEYPDNKVYFELVKWDTFRRGAGSRWEDVPWISYDHYLTQEDFKEKFPNISINKINFDCRISDVGVGVDSLDEEPSIFKRITIHEIWDKNTKQIIWIAPSYKDAPLAVEEDKLKLEGFFDTPRPLYAIDDTTTLVPVDEYSLYKSQARELNIVTQRITKLTECLKVRGIYDSTLTELGQMFKGEDGDLIAASTSVVAMQSGGLTNAIWIMPIADVAVVLRDLYVQREQIKASIYEITGLSDIMRGYTDPNETLGAQQLKAQNASVRIQRRQKDVQRYVRDVMRIMADVISEHYSPEKMTMISGIQVTPEVYNVLKRDLARGMKIDIETDSTIAMTQSQDRQDVSELMEAVGGFVNSFAPIIQSGALSIETGKKILFSILRKAKLGNDVEDAIQQEAENPPQPQEAKPDPALIQQQIDMQAKQQESAQKFQLEIEKLNSDHQMRLKEFELKTMETIKRLEQDNRKINIENHKLQLAHEEMQRKYAIEEQNVAIKKDQSDTEVARVILADDLQKDDLERRCELEHKKIDKGTSLELRKLRLSLSPKNNKDDMDDSDDIDESELDQYEKKKPPLDLTPIVAAIEKIAASKPRKSKTIIKDEQGNVIGSSVKIVEEQ